MRNVPFVPFIVVDVKLLKERLEKDRTVVRDRIEGSRRTVIFGMGRFTVKDLERRLAIVDNAAIEEKHVNEWCLSRA